jgi:hypothetical protein
VNRLDAIWYLWKLYIDIAKSTMKKFRKHNNEYVIGPSVLGLTLTLCLAIVLSFLVVVIDFEQKYILVIPWVLFFVVLLFPTTELRLSSESFRVIQKVGFLPFGSVTEDVGVDDITSFRLEKLEGNDRIKGRSVMPSERTFVVPKGVGLVVRTNDRKLSFPNHGFSNKLHLMVVHYESIFEQQG